MLKIKITSITHPYQNIMVGTELELKDNAETVIKFLESRGAKYETIGADASQADESVVLALNADIANLKEQVEAKDKYIVERETLITQHEATIADLEAKLAEATKE